MNTYNFIETYKAPKKLCDYLISYHKKNKEHKVVGVTSNGVNKEAKDSVDVYFLINHKIKILEIFLIY